MPSFRHEISLGRKSGAVICGVDEVGRGPLAGPVLACAATLRCPVSTDRSSPIPMS